MTLGHLTLLLQSADRILSSLRKPTAESLLERLAELADDEDALKKLHANLEALARSSVAARSVTITITTGEQL